MVSVSANPIDQRYFAPAEGRIEPFYFPSGERTLFGWLHRPAGDASLGMVICKPFGYEAITGHRSLLAFAERAAELGVPTLRFDYAGTGDSQDLDAGSDQLEVWSRDIAAAVAELQQRTGVERVCLLGFRLGAAMAVLAAEQIKCVRALITIAPVISGKRYLRELRTAKLAATQGALANSAKPAADGSMDFSGYTMSGATITALTQLDLSARKVPALSDALVIDRNDLPGARAWSEQLTAQGVRTHYQALSGLVEMMFTVPHFAIVPAAMVDLAGTWLSQLRPAALAPSPAPAAPASLAARRWQSVLHVPALAGEDVLIERPVFLSLEPMVFGIVTEPKSRETRRRGVIFVNDGATVHSGSNRMYVAMARRWAKRGYVVLRMDLAGLGDSGTRAGRPGNEVFPPDAMQDIRAAVEFMRSQYGLRDLTLGGLCAGAYHSLRAAVAGVSVNRILLVNPLNFFWEEGMTLDDVQLAEVAHNPSLYRERIWSAASWKRLLSGRVNVWRIMKIYFQRAGLELETLGRDVAQRLNIRLPQDLGRELEEIAARGIQTVFVFSRDDMGVNLLKIQAGSTVRRLGERCRVHLVDGADHVFSQSGPRAILEQILSDALFTRHRWQINAAAAEPDSSP